MQNNGWKEVAKVFVLQGVKKALPFVWGGLRNAMRTKTAKALCVVVGGALGAYGASKCDGAEAIAGIIIGVGIVGFTAIPFDKVLKHIPVNKLIGFFFKAKTKK